MCKSQETCIETTTVEVTGLAQSSVKAARNTTSMLEESKKFEYIPSKVGLVRIEQARLTEKERLGARKVLHHS